MGRKKVFVDVNTQYDFMSPAGRLYVPGAENLVPHLKQLTRWAQHHNIPILASMDAHPKNDPEFQQFPPHCLKGTVGQKKIPETLGRKPLVIENVPLDSSIRLHLQSELPTYDQLILEKQSFSLFENVNAETLFRKISADQYVVYGVATDYCVRGAVLGLLKLNAKVNLVEDAIAPVDEKTGRAALEEMVSAGARLVTTAEVIQ